MKKSLVFFIAIMLSVHSFAVVIPVTVSNFAFSPQTINANVGDDILFTWSSGTHTTTCGGDLPGTSHPAGAEEWDSPMNFGQTSFTYNVAVEGTYIYGCIFHFGGGAGMVGRINVSSVAPVTFGEFGAVAAGKKAHLSWYTLTEENTSYFSVKKSMDGIHFNKVAQLPAAGNSSSPLSYNYVDDISNDHYKFLYYEIATTDVDNKESLSPIRVVRSDEPNNSLIVQLGPNPVVRPQMMKILFNADGRGVMGIKIFSQSGRLVLKEQTETFYGLNDAHLHVCELAAGTYIAVFELNGKKESRKIIIR